MKVCGTGHVRVYCFPVLVIPSSFQPNFRFSMTTNYIFVTGGVVSSLGKGIAAASSQPFLKPVASM